MTFAFGGGLHLCGPNLGKERERHLRESVRCSGIPLTSPIRCITAFHSSSMLHVGDEMWRGSDDSRVKPNRIVPPPAQHYHPFRTPSRSYSPAAARSTLASNPTKSSHH
ncbi:hypothetical protein GALMADRAFT_879781 [Galerina marginata CBS 339.88]|uniref:Uncharacterized protein n=1 Tax=Galerina marginata (strain CBS 339.88) TaxID=685588 RepID=A0A067SSG8_GALM3|nr:hypothetical protein GALMADRAFT_879781 [Galerina marginata CBS 339.88]